MHQMDKANQQFQMRPTQIERSFAMCIFFIKAHCTYTKFKELKTFSPKGQPWGNLHRSHLLFLSMEVDCSYKNL
jgi:hypothetical protein